MANIRKRGNKFQVQIRRVGTKSLTKTFSRMTEARAWAYKMEVELQRSDAGILTPPKDTLYDLLLRYRSLITPHKKSHASESRRINRLLTESIVQKKIAFLTSEEISKFRDKRMKDGQRAASYDLQIIRHCVNIAMKEWGLNININPALNVRMPKQPRPRDRRLKREEYEKLVSMAKRSNSWFLYPLIIVAVETGMRLGEMLSLNWDDLDVCERFLTIRDTKNGKDRIIPLTHRALATIVEVPKSSHLIFNTNYEAVKSAWRRLLLKTDISDLRFHDLRHEATSRFFERGLTIPEVASITGHQTVSMLLRYAHADLEVLRSRIDEADEKLNILVDDSKI